jgi:hypothetical protein
MTNNVRFSDTGTVYGHFTKKVYYMYDFLVLYYYI